MILGSRRRRSGGNSNVLTFWTTCDNTSTFDPKITGVDGIWRFDDGSVLVGTSGVEISKTFASGGLHWAKFYPGVGGLATITDIIANADLITAITGLSRCALSGNAHFYTNVGLTINVVDISRATNINLSSGTLTVGTPSQISRSATYIAITNSPWLVGGLSDFPVITQTLIIYGCTGVTAGSVAGFVGARDFRPYNMGWLTADVDTVLLSVSDAIWANLGHFTYAAPVLQIGGTNQAPSGTIGAATTSPLVTPGAGNSDADWLWVEGVSEHYPVSGCAAVYYMRNNVGHAWAVTITGEA